MYNTRISYHVKGHASTEAILPGVIPNAALDDIKNTLAARRRPSQFVPAKAGLPAAPGASAETAHCLDRIHATNQAPTVDLDFETLVANLRAETEADRAAAERRGPVVDLAIRELRDALTSPRAVGLRMIQVVDLVQTLTQDELNAVRREVNAIMEGGGKV